MVHVREKKQIQIIGRRIQSFVIFSSPYLRHHVFHGDCDEQGRLTSEAENAYISDATIDLSTHADTLLVSTSRPSNTA